MGDANKLFGDLFDGRSATGAQIVRLSPRNAPARQWYLVVDGVQLGPVDAHEIEERWVSRELEEDSLVWRAGMAEWAPVADVTELVYLLTELPQTRIPPPIPSVARPGPRTTEELAPQSYRHTSSTAIDWKPSAAKALATLVELEMGETPAPQRRRTTDSVNTMALAGVPLFASGANPAPAAHNHVLATQPAHHHDPFAHFAAQRWQASPVVPAQSQGGIQPVHLFATVMAIALAGLLVIVGLLMPWGSRLEGFAQAPTKQAPTAAAPMSKPTRPALVPVVTTPEPVAKAPTPAVNKPSVQPVRRPRPMDDVFNARKKKRLTRNDIIEGVRQGKSSVSQCAIRAGRGRELLPGRYNLVLDFHIRSNGTVATARVKGPDSVLDTSLPACFALGVRKWRFAASQNGAPVRNFKFPITVR